MATVKLRSLPVDVAAKLEQLETRAAVLERDARNGRSITTLALNTQQTRARHFGSRQAISVWPLVFGPAYRAVRSSFVWLDSTARSPRLHAALRSIGEWLLECVVVLSATCATLLAIVIAILLLAPPE